MKTLLILLIYAASFQLYAETPTEDLALQKVKVEVPDKFKQFFKGNEELYLPKGFTISVFSAGFNNPRFFAWSPQGVLHVASINMSSIYAMPDLNADGIADTNIAVASGLDRPHSIAFFKDNMYVGETTKVRKFSDNNNDGIFETSEKFIDGIPDGGHYTRTVLIDSIQNYLYLSVGSSCDACRETDSLRATILRFKTDGTDRKIFASGVRNAVGMTIEPATGKLWATVAERNNFTGFPGDLITSIKENGFYGWPFAYDNKVWMDFTTPDYQKMLPLTAIDTQTVNSMQVPDASVTAHTTPLGLHFYQGSKFPAEYKNSAFVAVHGTGFDQPTPPRGYNVIRLKQTDGIWKTTDFLNGFLTSETEYKHWGRPCDVTEDKNGNIYISTDDVFTSGIPAIYKISYDPSLSGEYFKAAGKTLAATAFPNIINREERSFNISYSLPESGVLKITLYDAVGNLLKTIHNAYESAGEYRLPVELPTNISAGMIFYKLELHNQNGFKTVAGKLIVQ